MEGYIGQICLLSFGFVPNNWAACNGQLMAINQNGALYALLGVTYGGDGVTTFALPDLRGRVPISQGQGPGLSNHEMGQVGGYENVTLLSSQMPAHNHSATLHASAETADSPTATNRVLGSAQNFVSGVAEDSMAAQSITVSASGGSQPHSNMQPYIAMNYCICLYGIYPSRS